MLTALQLADLLNYLLKLPRHFGRKVTHPGMQPFILATWPVKIRNRAQIWCEKELRQAGVLPKLEQKQHGRGPVPPVPLRRYLGQTEYRRWAQ